MARSPRALVALLATALLALLLASAVPADAKKAAAEAVRASPVVGCYVGTWANYRQGRGSFKIEDIDAKLCTHLYYAFVGITEDGDVKSLDPWLDLPDGGGLNGFARFVALKKVNPKAKFLVSIGGWNEGSTKYSKVANDAALRDKFAANAVKFVQKYGFDGMDLDWEYPAQRGGAASDRAAFVELLKAMHAKFSANKLLLTAAVSVGQDKLASSYDVAGIMKYLDLVNLMTYDLHISTEGKTGMNAATRAGPGETDKLNVLSSVKLWLDAGGVPSKMVLGLPLYGHSFTLADASKNGVGAATTGPGTAGPYTQEAGTLSYLEICEKQQNGQFPEKWDTSREVPYAVQGNQWVSYDNPRSIKIKIQLAVQQYKLAGVMAWSLESDDFKNYCSKSGGAYPLMRAAYTALYSKKGLLGAAEAVEVPAEAEDVDDDVTVEEVVVKLVSRQRIVRGAPDVRN